LHPFLRISPREEYACKANGVLLEETVELPKLFKTYLRIGAKICGEPAIDRKFKTIDFFVIFDRQEIDQRYYQMFFG
jgi:putative hemolysin